MKRFSQFIFLSSVIFVLLVYGVPVYAATVADAGIAAIADKISLSIKKRLMQKHRKRRKRRLLIK